MTAQTLFFLIAGGLAGGFINGLAGFGTALFSLSFFLHIMSPIQAVATVIFMSAVVGLQGLWVVRAEITATSGRLMRFIIPALPGIPIGIWSLSYLDAMQMKMLVGLFMLGYGAFFGFRSALPVYRQSARIIDTVIGFLGGVLGGATGLSGALPTIWLSMRPYSKAETRALLQPFNVSVLGLSAAVLAAGGVYDSQLIQAILIALPAGFIASWAGIALFRRLSTEQFKRLLILMMLASGISVLVNSL